MFIKRIHTTSYYSSFRNELFTHLLFWIIYLIFPLVKSIGRSGYQYNFKSEFIDFFFGLIVFYVAYFLLFPLKSNVLKLVMIVLVFSAFGYGNFSFHNELFGGTHQRTFWFYAVSYFSAYTVLTLFAFALYSSKEAYQKRIALEEERLKRREAELFNLRAQINPHFLFNTLNTIYSSALKKEDKAPEMILKLSDNFRYVLQEGLNKYVTIEKEIIHLKDYISLQEERLIDKVSVDFTYSVDDYSQKIAPLLLISFVENSFKYVASLKSNSNKVVIKLSLQNRQLSFYCENPFSNQKTVGEDLHWKKSGIGIKNTKKRLEYLYPKTHDIRIQSSNQIFKVHLNISV